MGSLKICKCSHDKKDHMRFYRICERCPCSNYVNKNANNKLDKIMFVVIIGIFAVLVGTSVEIYHGFDIMISEVPAELLDEKINMTMGQFIKVIQLGIVLFMLFFYVVFIDPMIQGFLHNRKRKDYN